ncbi:MAG: pyridoxamine 5'-phosphate oxidase family protein [Candidatus Dormibacteraceae bacterium]
MTELEPLETVNLDGYGNPPLTWSRARDGLAAGTPGTLATCFLGTCGPGGRPHAAGIGALWFDGALYFVSGPGTRKSRDLASNPACTLSIRLPGIDLVCEGEAVRVTDLPTLQDAAARYRAGGWPAEVEGAAFVAPYSAPSAGPPPWHLYRVNLRSIVGTATAEPSGATRWGFRR